MDIQKIITDLVAKIQGNNDLVAQFKSNPVATVKKLVESIQLDDKALKGIADAVAVKLGADAGALDGVKSMLNNLFGR